MATVTGFTGCCGADILYGFSNDPKSVARYKYVFNPQTGRNEYAKGPDGKRITASCEDVFRETLAKQKAGYAKGGRMFCLILNETQAHGYDGAWLKIIKSEGFECVRRWTNANHNDPEYLYLFVLCTDEKGRCNGDHTVPPTGWDSIPTGKQDTITTTEVLGSKVAS